ncbi:MAG: hypothetical protein IPO92_09535 [Saprospiraceae bacterium]|nr:hypothetical protein [Saprospiraceae bacterium]
MDRYLNNNFGSFTIEEGNVKTDVIVKEDYYNGAFSSINGSFRYGIELEKDLGKHGRIGIQLMYSYLHTGNQVDIYTTMIQNKYEDAVNPFLLTSTKTEKIKYDGNQSGFLLGLNYYFGQFSWNVK